MLTVTVACRLTVTDPCSLTATVSRRLTATVPVPCRLTASWVRERATQDPDIELCDAYEGLGTAPPHGIRGGRAYVIMFQVHLVTLPLS
jgi:hypothetical protein